MKPKPKSSLNATKHGAYSVIVVLPWEDETEFDSLHTGLCNDLQPEGVLECEMVHDIAALIWRKRRVTSAVQLGQYRAPISREIRRSGMNNALDLQTFVQNRAKEHEDFCTRFEAKRIGIVRKLKLLARGIESKAKKEMADGLQRILSYQETLVPIAKELEQMNNEMKAFATAYDAQELERLLKLEASFSAQIEKGIARYFAIREYRRTITPKLITSDSPRLPPRIGRAKNVERAAGMQNSQAEGDDPNDQEDDQQFDWEHEYDEYQEEKKNKSDS